MGLFLLFVAIYHDFTALFIVELYKRLLKIRCILQTCEINRVFLLYTEVNVAEELLSAVAEV